MRIAALLLTLLSGNWDAYAKDVETHVFETEYQNGHHEIRVLLPDNYSKDRAYRVLYVLPVEKEFQSRFGYGLRILQQMNAHNRYDLIVVQMGLEKEPWFGDHATDHRVRQASFIKEFLVPYIESRYSTLGSAQGRLLFGFSKSGWGAISLIMHYPSYFGYAASWDAPLMFERFHFGMESVYGTIEQLEKYQFTELARQQKNHFANRRRLVIAGEKLWGTMRRTPAGEASHTVEAHQLLEREGIKHHYDRNVQSPHRWDKAWMEPTLKALMDLTGP